jgi:hypothetical protein
MLFDAQAALAEILAAPVATPATPATNTPEMPPVSQVSRLSQSQPAEIPAPATVLPITPPPGTPAPSRDEGDTFRHGHSFEGSPRTWTGRIVSLDEWQRLSAWDRHGPNVRLFRGICCDVGTLRQARILSADTQLASVR